jgi:hypothetical protein
MLPNLPNRRLLKIKGKCFRTSMQVKEPWLPNYKKGNYYGGQVHDAEMKMLGWAEDWILFWDGYIWNYQYRQSERHIESSSDLKTIWVHTKGNHWKHMNLIPGIYRETRLLPPTAYLPSKRAVGSSCQCLFFGLHRVVEDSLYIFLCLKSREAGTHCFHLHIYWHD